MRRILLLLVLAALVMGGVKLYPTVKKYWPSATTTTTTTTTTAPPTAPLTGLSDPSGLSVTRPALVIKIENTPDARPLFGVNHADMVYEEIVNGGITRLAAVFNSSTPDKVGPVRSVRPTDRSLIWPFGGIFAYSGGAPYAIEAVRSAPVIMVTESRARAAMFRDPARYAPHNLDAHAAGLFAFGGTPVPPQRMLTYLSPGQGVTGTRVSSVCAKFPSIYSVTWHWNAATASWDRNIFGKLDVTGTGERISPQNLVVMFINYAGGVGTFNSVGVLEGSGRVVVFEKGKEIVGTWSRSTLSDPISYRTAAGKTIAMTPGQTWVELLNTGAGLTTTP